MRSAAVRLSFVWLAVVLLSISFMSLPDVEGIDYGRYTTISLQKFIIHIFAFAVILFVLFSVQRTVFNLSLPILLYIIYIIIMFVSVLNFGILNGRFDTVMFARWFDLALIIPLIIVFAHVGYDEGMRILFWATFLPICCVLLLWVFVPEVAWRTTYNFGYVSTPRLGGSIIPPNTLGGMAATASIMALSLKMKHAVRVAIIALLLVVLIASQSRAAVLSMVLAVSLGVLMLPNKKTKNVFFILLFSLIGFCIIYFSQSYLISVVPDRIFRTAASFGGRSQLWILSLENFTSSGFNEIFFGQGLCLPNNTYVTGNLVTRSLHNGYLQILLGLGLIAFTVYIAMLFSSAIPNKRTFPQGLTHSALAIFNILWCFTELGAGIKLNIFTLILAFLLANANRPYFAREQAHRV